MKTQFFNFLPQGASLNPPEKIVFHISEDGSYIYIKCEVVQFAPDFCVANKDIEYNELFGSN